jgi:hypothetical protein
MKTQSFLSVVICTLLSAVTPAHAAGNLSVNEQVTLNASADTVWQLVGNFATLNTWHPAVVKESVTGTGQDAGDTRVLTLGDGGTITEVLVDSDNSARQYTYVIKQSPLPVSGYLSTIKVLPEGKDKAKVIWSSTFNAKGATAKEAMDAVRGVYSAGFQALVKRVP